MFLACLACLASSACTKVPAEAPLDASEQSTDTGETDATVASTEVDAGLEDAGRGNLITLAAVTQTSVLDTVWWPESGKGGKRLGYLRHGALVTAYEHPTINEDCKDGWYELDSGGFVCGKAVTADLTSPRVRLAPKQPDHDAGMPYKYGVNLRDGTPLYRRVLSSEDRKKYEPHLASPKPTATEEGTAATEGEKTEKTERTDKTEAREARDNREGRENRDKDRTERDRSEKVEGSSEEPGTSPRRAETSDAGAPARPKLKQLKGRGVLVRTMARGFYLALDRAFNAAGTRWWRTSFGFAVPFDRIMLQPGVTKHVGSWFLPMAADGSVSSAELADAGALAFGDASAFVNTTTPTSAAYSSDASDALGMLDLQDAGSAGTRGRDSGAEASADGGVAADAFGTVGFVTISSARKLELSADEKKILWGPELPKRSAVMLDGRRITIGGGVYHHTFGGFWVRMMDLKIARPAIPADLAPNEKWIDVDLTRQALVAFEGVRPVFATLISSGRRNLQDKEKDFPTPTGQFRIHEKHVTTTMDGDVASDGPYSIEDVPWVMYFQGSYALHGAFWHDSFGYMRSHGCVNMAPEDARTLFAWTEPALPRGWHGVFSRDDASGTRLVVHEDTPPKRR